MGLDQYAFKVRNHAVISDTQFKDEIDNKKTYEEIYYWRKVPALQGFMEKLYYEKGGKNTFNCESIRLYEEDLDKLKYAIEHNEMPVDTIGFFFGKHSEEDMPSVLKFVKIAKKAIKEGDAVYYSSWW